MKRKTRNYFLFQFIRIFCFSFLYEIFSFLLYLFFGPPRICQEITNQSKLSLCEAKKKKITIVKHNDKKWINNKIETDVLLEQWFSTLKVAHQRFIQTFWRPAINFFGANINSFGHLLVRSNTLNIDIFYNN